MKFLKWTGIIVLILLAVFLIVPLFMKPTFAISRSLEVKGSPEVVFNKVVNFSSWKIWSPWYRLEPTAKNEITGIDGTPGAKNSWSGKKVGSGEMTLTAVDPLNKIDIDLHFTKPMEAFNKIEFTFEPNAGNTKVTWTMKGESSYPMGRWFGLMMDGMVGKDFENGLKNLDSLVKAEAMHPAAPTAEPQDSAATEEKK